MSTKPSAQTRRSFSGMTLVELLVVVAIMVMLLAVSVPILKPMLESRRTANAAQVLAATLQQARMKAMTEQKSYGVMFLPFETAPSAALQLRLQKNVPPFINDETHRVIVVNDQSKNENTIYHVERQNGQWVAPSLTLPPEFQEGTRVQFNRQGRFYVIEKNSDGNLGLAAPYNTLTLPVGTVQNTPPKDALEYYLVRKMASTLIPQTVMPRGTIVDLAFSGGEVLNFDGKDKNNANPEEIPMMLPAGEPVVVMFSPAGNTDLLYIGNNPPQRVNEMLYFCVGEWDRQVDAAGKTLAEDGQTNLAASASYWVTIHPKTGEIRIAENAPVKNAATLPQQLRNARKFASEHFFNIGGN